MDIYSHLCLTDVSFKTALIQSGPRPFTLHCCTPWGVGGMVQSGTRTCTLSGVGPATTTVPNTARSVQGWNRRIKGEIRIPVTKCGKGHML